MSPDIQMYLTYTALEMPIISNCFHPLPRHTPIFLAPFIFKQFNYVHRELAPKCREPFLPDKAQALSYYSLEVSNQIKPELYEQKLYFQAIHSGHPINTTWSL